MSKMHETLHPIQDNFTMLVCIKQAMKNKIDFKMMDNYLSRIRDLKTWSDQHAPGLLKPALSYALDWLAPELLGTGFEVQTLNDQKIRARIPYRKSNCDFQGEIHAGLVVNSGFQMLQTFLAQHWPQNLWRISNYQIELTKNTKWQSDLQLEFFCSDSDLDRMILFLQKNDQMIFEGQITIGSDYIKFKITMAPQKLLA